VFAFQHVPDETALDQADGRATELALAPTEMLLDATRRGLAAFLLQVGEEALRGGWKAGKKKLLALAGGEEFAHHANKLGFVVAGGVGQLPGRGDALHVGLF